MVRIALIFILFWAIGCAGKPPTVFIDRPVKTIVSLPVPCVRAGDRRPPPTPLADEALPPTAKQLVAALVAKLHQFYGWAGFVETQLDACTKE